MVRAGRWLLLSLPPLAAALIVWFGAVVLPIAAGTVGMTGRWAFAVQLIVIGPVALGIPIAVALSIVEDVIGQRGRMNVGLVTSVRQEIVFERNKLEKLRAEGLEDLCELG